MLYVSGIYSRTFSQLVVYDMLNKQRSHMPGEEDVLLVFLCIKSFLPMITRVSLHQIAKRP